MSFYGYSEVSMYVAGRYLGYLTCCLTSYHLIFDWCRSGGALTIKGPDPANSTTLQSCNLSSPKGSALYWTLWVQFMGIFQPRHMFDWTHPVGAIILHLHGEPGRTMGVISGRDPCTLSQNVWRKTGEPGGELGARVLCDMFLMMAI